MQLPIAKTHRVGSEDALFVLSPLEPLSAIDNRILLEKADL
jgi:hypothetical protein